MPVLRSITNYRLSDGRERRVRLYGAWKNLRGRVSGRLYAGNRKRAWKGLAVGFRDWRHFRQWALANGYSKERNSLDRIDPAQGYKPSNCRWVTVSQNTSYQVARMGLRRAYAAGLCEAPF